MLVGTSDCVDATVLDLAHSNTVASRDLVSQLCRVTAGKPEDPNWRVRGSVPNVMKPTAGERLAQRVRPTAPIVCLQHQVMNEDSPKVYRHIEIIYSSIHIGLY